MGNGDVEPNDLRMRLGPGGKIIRVGQVKLLIGQIGASELFEPLGEQLGAL